MNYNRVAKGDPIKPSASEWNALMDLVKRQGQTSKRPRGPVNAITGDEPLCVTVKNTGSDIGIGEWFQIIKPLEYTGSGVTEETRIEGHLFKYLWQGSPLAGASSISNTDTSLDPTFNSGFGYYALHGVTVEPIGSGDVGRVAIKGVVAAKIYKGSGTTSGLENRTQGQGVQISSTGKPELMMNGPHIIVWFPTGTFPDNNTERWCLVDLNCNPQWRFSPELVGDFVADIVTDTTNISWAYDDAAGKLEANLTDTTVTPGSYTNAEIIVDQKGRITFAASGSGGSYTDENAQDAVGNMLADTTEIDFVYDDATPKIEASIKTASVANSKLANVGAAKLVGRRSGSSGEREEITPNTGLEISGTNLNCTLREVPIGGVILWTTGTAPTNYQLCDGTAISRSTYATLFALVGTTWGVGDGLTTFNVPDLRGRTPIGAGTGSGLTARTLAGTVGNETHTLSTSEIPSHSHTKHVAFGDAGTAFSDTNVWANVNGITSFATGYTGAEGGGGSHNNMQPSLVVNFAIRIS
jgi:microcystin-dependent protein